MFWIEFVSRSSRKTINQCLTYLPASPCLATLFPCRRVYLWSVDGRECVDKLCPGNNSIQLLDANTPPPNQSQTWIPCCVIALGAHLLQDWVGGSHPTFRCIRCHLLYWSVRSAMAYLHSIPVIQNWGKGSFPCQLLAQKHPIPRFNPF